MEKHSIQESLRDLNNLVMSGRLLDAFEKYYHDEVVMQENDNPPVIGKTHNRNRELLFVQNVEEFRSASVESIAISDDTSFVLWNYDYTHREWGLRKYNQVSVQNWKDGKIIWERFFYGN